MVVGGRFLVERQVGSGGMGAVYRAVDRLEGGWVALKVMVGDDPTDAERFHRESSLLAGLRHPAIVRYVAHGSGAEGTRFVAMEWLEGEDLEALLARRRLSLAEALALGRRAGAALGFAHARGVVHRDFKPSNLFLPGGQIDRLKLIDFGVARGRGGRRARRRGYRRAPACAGASPAVVARIVDHAEGSPFYLEELVCTVAAGRGDVFPNSVLATVEARLDAEGPDAKRILRAASVFGERFSRDGVAALLGGEARRDDAGDWLELLTTRELTAAAGPAGSDGDRAYVFRHALVREAANAMLTEADRALGHKLAGAWLERTGHPEPLAIAEHFRRGGDPAHAVSFYCRAAERDLEANDLDAVLSRVELGVSCGAAGEELGALRLCEAEARQWRGDFTMAEDRAREAMALFRVGTLPWFRSAGRVAIAAGKQAAIERVEALIGPVLTAAPVPEGPSAQILALSEIAIFLTFAGRYVDVDPLLADITRLAAGPGEVEASALAHLREAHAVRATVAGDLGAGLDGFRAAISLREHAGDRRNAAISRSNLGFVLAELGDFSGAEDALRAVLQTSERMEITEVYNMTRHNLGRVLGFRGGLAEAHAVEQRLLEEYRAGDPRFVGAVHNYLAQIELLAGDLAAAEGEARTAVEALAATPPLRAYALAVLARALLRQGRTDEAFEAAREAYAQLEADGSLEEGEAAVRLVYAETLAARGSPELGAILTAACDRLLSRAAKISDPSWRERFLTAVPDNARTLTLAVAHGVAGVTAASIPRASRSAPAPAAPSPPSPRRA
jgi:tetratricopeptide (TPR) repeat protein